MNITPSRRLVAPLLALTVAFGVSACSSGGGTAPSSSGLPDGSAATSVECPTTQPDALPAGEAPLGGGGKAGLPAEEVCEVVPHGGGQADGFVLVRGHGVSPASARADPPVRLAAHQGRRGRRAP